MVSMGTCKWAWWVHGLSSMRYPVGHALSLLTLGPSVDVVLAYSHVLL
jgi:hypothetical protein